MTSPSPTHLLTYLAKRSPKSCNDDKTYDTVLKLIDGPSSKDEKSLYQGSVRVIKACLKDKQFKKDIMDEQNSLKNGYRYRNVCNILKAEKLIKKCYES